MDTDAETSLPETTHKTTTPDVCGYCGAALNRLYYFCTTCATPYQHHRLVVSRARPEPMGLGALIKRRAPVVWPLFWTYAVILIVGSVVATLAWGDAHPEFVMFFLDAALGITTVFFATAHWKSLVPQLARIGFDHWEAWAGLGALVPLLAINIVYHEWISGLAGVEGGNWLTDLRDAGLTHGTLLFFICVFPGITEEIAFRGLVQHWLTPAIGATKALLLASALFTAMHFNVLSAPPLFLAGMLLGWVKLRTGSLYPSMVIHALHNWAVLEYVAG